MPALLWAGVIAPVLFTIVYLLEGASRAGYDPMRYQVSLLSLGPGGWVQVLAFLVTGVLLLVFAVALRARLGGGPGGSAGPLSIAIAASGFIVAGLFTTQPLFGYPPGTPEGMSTDITAASLLHVLGAAMLFFGLVTGALVLARRSWHAGDRAWAVGSVAAAIVVLVCFGASGGGPSGQLLFPETSGLLQRISLLAGLGWLAAVALRTLRSRPS
jgi:hypothetical protein